MCKELEDIKSEEEEVDGEEDEVDEVDQEDPLDLSVPIPNPSVSLKSCLLYTSPSPRD